MYDELLLQICPRSGLGIKYGLRLANTVGIIDSDYYDNPGNEGHILVKLVNDSTCAEGLLIPANTAICQGIFLPFGMTTDDGASGKRNGGFGSTNELNQSTREISDIAVKIMSKIATESTDSTADRVATER